MTKESQTLLYRYDNDDNEGAFHERMFRSISSHSNQIAPHSCLNSQQLQVQDLH